SVHQDTDCDWDAVGNVYYIDALGAAGGNGGVWRAFSPPGANQSSLTAVATVALGGASTRPYIRNIGLNPAGDTVTINFTGSPTDQATDFGLLGADDAAGPYAGVAGSAITGTNGIFQATAPANGVVQFYRIQR